MTEDNKKDFVNLKLAVAMSKINEWLDKTVRNEYYYISDKILSDRTFYKDWKEIVKGLENAATKSWSREEYLEWVSLWKTLYSKLTLESRWSKVYRASTRIVAKTGMNSLELATNIANENLFHFRVLRVTANNLLGMR